MSKQILLYAVLIMYGLICYLMLVLSGRTGNWAGAVVAILLASPGALYALRLLLESEFDTNLFSVKHQSWAFLFGDFIFLPFAAAMATLGWLKLKLDAVAADSWYNTYWWLILCAVIGVLAGATFHYMDSATYTKAGAELALLSPTKLAHDFVAYPVLFGGLLYLGAPVLFSRFWWPYGVLILIGIALWGAMGAKDATGLDPNKLHPKWDPVEFRVIQ